VRNRQCVIRRRLELETCIGLLASTDGMYCCWNRMKWGVRFRTRRDVYRSSGIDAAIRTYRRLKAQSESEYDLSEGELNSLGYQILYADHHAQDATMVFALNVEEHPTSSNAFDSLAEAYRVGGNTQAARANYEKALVLDPTNEHARTALSQIK
jgi:tetratricopeptide (TPR) repeat protein